jgi:hypothetical protein
MMLTLSSTVGGDGCSRAQVVAMQKIPTGLAARVMNFFALDERQGLEADAIIHTSMNVCISSQHHINLAKLFETA